MYNAHRRFSPFTEHFCIDNARVIDGKIRYFELCRKLKAFYTLATGILKPCDCFVTMEDSTYYVKKGAIVTDGFKVGNGLKQGDGLAPNLFNIALGYVIRQLLVQVCINQLKVLQNLCVYIFVFPH
jgi:hypothetical protein